MPFDTQGYSAFGSLVGPDASEQSRQEIWRADMQTCLRFALVLATAFVAAGCQTMGPGSIPRDRIDYARAMGDSWKEQTLLNIVKLRYLDPPVFLDVSSVISSYQLESQVNVAADIFPRSPIDTNYSPGVRGTYTDRPTISYTPLTGERFINSLLRPILPQTIFVMMGAGHPADFILQATVRAINGIYNYSASPPRARRADPQFYLVTEAIRRIQQAGALGVRIEKRGDQDLTIISFRRKVGKDVEKDIRFVKDALGLNPNNDEFLLTFGLVHRSPDEIALLTRSMQEILSELSAGVEVPEQDLIEGRATPRPRPDPDADPRNYPLVRIQSSGGRPLDAYAAVSYRNYWFWIDDRDLNSKRVFMFLMMFSSLAETGAVPQRPIITIPAR